MNKTVNFLRLFRWKKILKILRSASKGVHIKSSLSSLLGKVMSGTVKVTPSDVLPFVKV